MEFNDTGADVYAFFESTDDATFYRRQISDRTKQGSRLRIYLCGNKRSVWYHYEFAEQEKKLRNTLFFVDKDLDNFTDDPLPVRSRIFVTDLYSVENYLCTDEAVTAVLEQLIFLPDDGDDYRNILTRFRDGFEGLAMDLRPLFAEIVLLRRKNVVVSFSDFGDSLTPCFVLEDTEARSLPNWGDTFRSRCKYDTKTLLPADIQSMEALLSTKPHHEWLRGKFALWFFIHFIELLWVGLVGKYINDKKKIKKTLDLRPDNVFVAMQGKHPQPRGLNEFLAAYIS